MSVQFILGRSGTGKTFHCISAIADILAAETDHAPIVLLVPEQATYQAERAILADPRIAGYTNLHILSFERLQYMLIGRNYAKSDLSRIGQEMIVRKILCSIADKLDVFHNTASTPGLAEKLTSTIIELHRCAKTPVDLQSLAADLQTDSANSLTARKFADIATIYESYIQFIKDTDKFINHDIQLTYATDHVDTEPFMQNATLYVDGFANFTAQQRDMLRELIKKSRDSYIALCLDHTNIDFANPSCESVDPSSMFSVTEKTYAELTDLINKLKLSISDPLLLTEPRRFASALPLARIEAGLFASRSFSPISSQQTVRILTPTNGRAEIDFVAREIIALVRQNNYRFRDIAVVAPDVTTYQHYIEAVFNDYGIEFFLDRPKPISNHPVIELITSALNIVLNGFTSSDVFAFLKTGLTNLTSDEIGNIENYCLAFGIDIANWTTPEAWNFASADDNSFDEAMIDALRKKACRPLHELRQTLFAGAADSKQITVKQFTASIFNMLESLNVRNKIADWPNTETDHQQFFDKLIDIFDELSAVFADDTASVEDFFAILSNAFSKLTLKLIPQTLDQVLVGSIDRSRHPELKAVFLIGTTQKNFPTPVDHDSILTDHDRTVALNNGFDLSDTLTDQLTARRYLAYIAFTRPSDRLYITYPQADDTGTPCVPSIFLNDLQTLFTDLCPEPPRAPKLTEITSIDRFADSLCTRLSPDKEFDISCHALAKALANHPDRKLSDTGRFIHKAVNYNNTASLDQDIVADLMPSQLTCSTTRLSTFAACPFKYFAQYTLDLKPRKQATFEPMDLGIFYHNILDRVSKSLIAQEQNFAAVTDQDLRDLCKKHIAALLEDDRSLAHFKQRSMHNTFIINSAAETIEDCLIDYARLAKVSAFTLAASEIEFGPGKDNQCAIELDDGTTLNLTGKIDRLDIANIDGLNVALLYDYKRTARSVDWKKIACSLDIQLPVYMLAAGGITIAGKKIDRLAGAFFLPIEYSLDTDSPDNLRSSDEKFSRKARGIFNGSFCDKLDTTAENGWNSYYNFYIGREGPYGHFNKSAAMEPDQFQKLLAFVQNQIVHLAKDIFSGRIDIKPARISTFTPCEYCNYRSFCRFDLQINEYNDLPPVTKQQLVEQLEASDVN